jgi:hypothetical protein
MQGYGDGPKNLVILGNTALLLTQGMTREFRADVTCAELGMSWKPRTHHEIKRHFNRERDQCLGPKHQVQRVYTLIDFLPDELPFILPGSNCCEWWRENSADKIEKAGRSTLKCPFLSLVRHIKVHAACTNVLHIRWQTNRPRQISRGVPLITRTLNVQWCWEGACPCRALLARVVIHETPASTEWSDTRTMLGAPQS